LTHEIIGQKIIVNKLGEIISLIGRSPSGAFARGEVLDPRQIAYLIKMPEAAEKDKQPRWLQLLRQLFSGIYTVDNLDYVQRGRLYDGLFPRYGRYPPPASLHFFYQRRPYFASIRHIGARTFSQRPDKLYGNVYFHRTTRALDLHLQEIFHDTMKLIFPGNPLNNLNGLLAL